MSTIEYKQLSSEYLQDALNLMKKSFYVDENVCKAIGLKDNPEAINELEELTLRASRDGVSVIAIDTTNNKVVGAAFNKLQVNTSNNDSYFENYEKNYCKHRESKAVMRFMIDIDSACNLFEHSNVNCLMEIMFLGVSSDYRGQGIGLNLCRESIKIAKELLKGNNIKKSIDGNVLTLEPIPKVVTAIFTTFITQKIGRKLGFTIAKQINYNDIYFEGKSYFSMMEDNDKINTPTVSFEYLKL